MRKRKAPGQGSRITTVQGPYSIECGKKYVLLSYCVCCELNSKIAIFLQLGAIELQPIAIFLQFVDLQVNLWESETCLTTKTTLMVTCRPIGDLL